MPCTHSEMVESPVVSLRIEREHFAALGVDGEDISIITRFVWLVIHMNQTRAEVQRFGSTSTVLVNSRQTPTSSLLRISHRPGYIESHKQI